MFPRMLRRRFADTAGTDWRLCLALTREAFEVQSVSLYSCPDRDRRSPRSSRTDPSVICAHASEAELHRLSPNGQPQPLTPSEIRAGNDRSQGAAAMARCRKRGERSKADRPNFGTPTADRTAADNGIEVALSTHSRSPRPSAIEQFNRILT